MKRGRMMGVAESMPPEKFFQIGNKWYSVQPLITPGYEVGQYGHIYKRQSVPFVNQRSTPFVKVSKGVFNIARGDNITRAQEILKRTQKAVRGGRWVYIIPNIPKIIPYNKLKFENKNYPGVQMLQQYPTDAYLKKLRRLKNLQINKRLEEALSRIRLKKKLSGMREKAKINRDVTLALLKYPRPNVSRARSVSPKSSPRYYKVRRTISGGV